jgi:uncharacterized protein
MSAVNAAAGAPPSWVDVARAVRAGDVALLRRLLESGGAVVDPTGREDPPLLTAVLADRIDLASILLRAGAHANRPVLRAGTLLGCATSAAMVRVLVAGGADVNAVDGSGRTALMVAADGSPRCVRALLEAGARVNVADVDGQTPLHWAATMATAQLLLQAGADVHAVDRGGCTALHWATRFARPGLASVLLQHGADARACDAAGRTLVDLCGVDADSDDTYREGEGWEAVCSDHWIAPATAASAGAGDAVPCHCAGAGCSASPAAPPVGRWCVHAGDHTPEPPPPALQHPPPAVHTASDARWGRMWRLAVAAMHVGTPHGWQRRRWAVVAMEAWAM